MKKKSIQHEVLQFLLNQDKPITTREVAEHFEAKPQTVSVMMKRLRQNGWVKAIPDRGHAYKYIANKDKRFTQPTSANAISLDSVYQLINQWSQNKWEPKVLNSLNALPITLSNITSLVVDLSKGEHITQDIVDSNKVALARLLSDLDQLKSVVYGILNSEIWDIKILATYLLEKHSTDELSLLSVRIKEKNQ